MRRLIGYFGGLWAMRLVVLEFAFKDFRKRFLGSYLGGAWAFVQPMVMLVILWFLFTVGFKAGRVGSGSHPFFVWLASGMIVWNFFQEALLSATGVFVEYSFLVRKVHFRLGILPIVKIFSAFFIHLIFLLLLVLILLIHGYAPRLSWLFSLYYLFGTFLLVLGLSWITASINVFVRDVGQLVSIFLQFGFWLTPIFWPLSMIPVKYHFIFKLNPLWYVTEGYRRAFLDNQGFFSFSVGQNLLFWGIVVLILISGLLLFRKMKFQFADVL